MITKNDKIALCKLKKEREQNILEYENLNENDKIKVDIQYINSQIKNCEIDLNGMFKNNILIIEKIKNLKTKKNELQKQIK